MPTPKTYKIENLLNESGALYDLFNILTTNKEENAKDLSEKLIQNYKLEGEHYKRFEKISQKTEIANEIVKTLEDKFGVDEQGYIIDLKGFCNLVLDGRISKNREIKSYNVAFGHIQKNWKYEGRLGYVNGWDITQDCLLNLKKLIEKNRMTLFNKEDSKNLFYLSKKCNKEEFSSLIFNIPERKYIAKLNDKNNYENIIDHELRHIFDKFIIDDDDYGHTRFIETQAEIYSNLSLRGLKRDFKDFGKEDLERRIKIQENRLPKLKEIKAPEIIIQNEERLLEENKTKLNNGDYNNIDIRRIILAFKNIPTSAKEIKSLSYFFSILPEEEVPYYIQKAREFYNERKISNEIKEEFKNLSDKI